MSYSKLSAAVFAAAVSLFVQTVSAYSKFDDNSDEIRQPKPKRQAMIKTGNQSQILKPHARKIKPILTNSNSQPEQKPRKPYMMTR